VVRIGRFGKVLMGGAILVWHDDQEALGGILVCLQLVVRGFDAGAAG
jgi:hypothetical protein